MVKIYFIMNARIAIAAKFNGKICMCVVRVCVLFFNLRHTTNSCAVCTFFISRYAVFIYEFCWFNVEQKEKEKEWRETQTQTACWTNVSFRFYSAHFISDQKSNTFSSLILWSSNSISFPSTISLPFVFYEAKKIQTEIENYGNFSFALSILSRLKVSFLIRH